MEHALRRVISNPFLKENPFRSHESFFSSVSSFQPQPCSHSKNNQNYSYLSVLPNEKRPSIGSANITLDPTCLKKKSNPFFRKNLISQNKEQNDDCFEGLQVNFKHQQKRVDRPEFLKNNVEEASQNSNAYKSLAYRTPTSNSKNYISLDVRQNSNEKYRDQQGINRMKLGLGHLLSPRFPSVKVMENKQNSPTKLVPVITYKSSMKYLEESQGSSKREKVKSKRNSVAFGSHKQLSNRENRNEAERDQNKPDGPAWRAPSDENPAEITVRGTKYYRQPVEGRSSNK